MSLPFYRYIVLDGNKYPIVTDTYSMQWLRTYTPQFAANIVRLNFIDRGPGIRSYSMTLILESWSTKSLPYQDGIISPWNAQLQNLETSYSLNASILHFEDPFGRSPNPVTGGTGDYGVFFTDLKENFPKYSTVQKPFMLCSIKLTEATQLVNT